tara:strand:- start:628 stop:1908 length:1281 start_codon:yes stop_codon:yes gene_type:complete
MAFKNLDRQFDYLPKDVVFCKNCVVSNQRPRITFDKNGICSACQWAFEKDNIIDWEKRESELIQLLDKCRSKDGSFDVVVPGSGGKDSVFVAHQLKHRYNMNPICVTWAPFEYTDIGWKNLHNFVMSGFNNIIGQPDGMIHRKLARLALRYKGDAWEPFAYGQMSWALHIAKMYNVKLIIYGENGDLEYGGSDKLKYKPNDSIEDWEEIYYKSSGIDELVELGIQDKIFTKEEATKEKLKWYSAPNPDIIKEVGMETHYWSYYHSWIPQENFYYASTYNGFETNNFGHSEGTYTKYVSLDDKSDGFHWYLSFMKFGMSRASRDAQQDIRRNHITRDEGIALTKRYDGEYPMKYHDWFLKYLGISDEELWGYLDRYRELSNVWEKRNGGWYLKDAVWYEKDNDESFSRVKRPKQTHSRENRIDDIRL